MSKLTKPARIGATIFGVGVDESAVIARAQREYEKRLGQGKSGPLHVAAALPRVVLVDWEERYKRDLHNFMELERWLNKNHPSVMEEWENS